MIHARPFRVPGRGDAARLSITVNSENLAHIGAIQDFVLCLKLPACTRGETLLIAFETPDCGRPADFGVADGRTLGMAFFELVIAPRDAAIADLVAVIADQLGPPGSTAEADVARWAASEMLPWALLRPRRAWLTEQFAQLNIAGGCRIFAIAGNRVAAWPKPPEAEITDTVALRGDEYHAFLADVAQLLPPALATEVCIAMADSLHTHYPIPMMTLQKQANDAALLIPDMEFLQHGYFAGAEFNDAFRYEEKWTRAVFSGATTGGPISEHGVRTLALPRIRAATHFDGSMLVDFRLPAIVQCTDTAAEALLRASPFCQRPRLDWATQYRYRFLISMDGNGAPCSRQYLALRSQSALLMYESPNLLFYFRGLVPDTQYVPIRQDQDVERVIAAELASPGNFRAVAENGRSFANTYLTQEMRRRYMAMLLVLHAASFSQTQ